MVLKMDSRIKVLWVEALRSGKYEQGKHALRSADNKYCCLGVLCEIAVKEGAIEPPTQHEYGSYVYEQMATAFLPPTVLTWANMQSNGLSTASGQWGNSRHETLSWLNDDGVPFAEIADTIEREIEAVA